MKINVNLYGAFRQLGMSKVTLDVPNNSTCANLREIINDHLLSLNFKIPHELVQASVFASDEEVLNNSDVLIENMMLAILPPVCGG